MSKNETIIKNMAVDLGRTLMQKNLCSRTIRRIVAKRRISDRTQHSGNYQNAIRRNDN